MSTLNTTEMNRPHTHDHMGHGHGHGHGHDHGHQAAGIKRSLPSLLTGLLLAIILLLYMVTYQVRFTEVAVVRTFGKIGENGVKMNPGLYLKWPWPVQQVKYYDNRLQVSTTTGEEILTKDGKNIIVTTAVNWRISDPLKFSQKFGDEMEAEGKLKSIVRNDQRRIIGQHQFTQFISNDPLELRYDEIASEIESAVRKDCSEMYGMEISTVKLETLALPSRVTEDVFEAMKKDRQALAARYTSEGESHAQQIKDTAESIAGTIRSFALRQAAEIEAEGQRRAADYNRVFAQDQELAQFLIMVNKLPDILKDRTTLILDAASAGFTPLLSDKAPAHGPTQQAATSQPANQAQAVLQEILPQMMDNR